MCLETVKKTYCPPKKVESVKGKFKVGYKVLRDRDTTFSGPYFGLGSPFGKWLHSGSAGSIEYSGDVDEHEGSYEPGFHIFTTLKAAKEYQEEEYGSIFRVQYNDVVAEGTHYTSCTHEHQGCVVARRMRVFKKDKVK